MCFIRLPHPEEKISKYGATQEYIEGVVNKWLMDWRVPKEYWQFWVDYVDIELSVDVKVAASYQNGKRRRILVNPYWLNCGVISHEQGHNSLALLEFHEFKSFPDVLAYHFETNDMIKYLSKKKDLSDPIEAHAELYRYINERLPDDLKVYYPKLF